MKVFVQNKIVRLNTKQPLWLTLWWKTWWSRWRVCGSLSFGFIPVCQLLKNWYAPPS